MHLRRVILVLAALVGSFGLATQTAAAKPPTATAGADCTLPESDAEALAILNYFYPNKYVWDDTRLDRRGAGGAQRVSGPRGRRGGGHRGLGRGPS